MYLEQCVQSKHREITNYYINITVAFIASSISDLVILEGQSLYTNSHPLCVLLFFLLSSSGGLKKNLGIPLAVFQEKKPFPPKLPRNRRSDGGRFVVDKFSVPLHSNFSFQFCQGHILVIITYKVRSSQIIRLMVLLVTPS